jgi:hypothetical protein
MVGNLWYVGELDNNKIIDGFINSKNTTLICDNKNTVSYFINVFFIL